MTTKYHSLETMLRDFSSHEWELPPIWPLKIPDPKVAIKKNTIHVETSDGKVFEADASFLMGGIVKLPSIQKLFLF